MNCAEFELELNRVLDRRALDDLGALQLHTATCAGCRQSLEQSRWLMEAITVWRAAVPEVDLADAVALACSEEVDVRTESVVRPASVVTARLTESPFGTAVSTRRPWAVYSTLAALAASLLVAILLISDRPGAPTEPGNGAVVQEGSPSGGRTDEAELALLGQAGDAYGRIARSAAGALEEFAVIVIPGAGTTASRRQPVDSTEGRLSDGLPHQLQPIGRSLGDALDFLWEVGTPPADSRT